MELLGVAALLLAIWVAWLVIRAPTSNSSGSAPETPRTVNQNSQQTVATPKVPPAAVRRPSAPAEVPKPRVQALSAVLGASEAAAQAEIRRTLVELSKKLDIAVANAEHLLDFETAVQLHRESAQAADIGYKKLSLARQGESLVRASQTDAHDRLKRYGRTYSLNNELDLLHQQRQLLKLHVQESKEFLDAYNIQTGALRDRITDSFGERGRRWRHELEERKRRRNNKVHS